jgi:hypothetical protein
MYKIGNWQDLGVDPQQSNRVPYCFFKKKWKRKKKKSMRYLYTDQVFKLLFFVLRYTITEDRDQRGPG